MKYFLIKYHNLIILLFISFYIKNFNLLGNIIKIKYFNNNIFNASLLALLYSLNPQIKKLNSTNLSIIESMTINHIFQSLILIIYHSYNGINYNAYVDINFKNILYYIINVFFTFFQSFLFNTLIRNNNVSIILPIINSSTGIITLLLGYFMFNEKLIKKNIIGIIFITTGSYLLYQ
tara:strand:+ start:1349 stop:1879 length:531 start_codon:yes stop_codon:yes gene_type:complete